MKKTLLKFAGIGLIFVYSFFSGRYLASLFSLPSSSTETAASSEAVENWGLGFQKDGTRPTANATIDELKKYNAHYAADTNKKKIYLTFDCGYENGNTGKILDTLKAHHAKATFFVVGNFITSNPELIKRIHKEGHIVGNHSNKHITYPSLSLEEAKEDLMSLHQYMLDTYQYKMTVFRFPEGNFSEQTLALVQSCGYKSLFWSFAYKDWYTDNQPNPADALSSMLNKAHPGAIYLLHAVSATNAQVLGDFINGMQEKGYVFSDFE